MLELLRLATRRAIVSSQFKPRGHKRTIAPKYRDRGNHLTGRGSQISLSPGENALGRGLPGNAGAIESVTVNLWQVVPVAALVSTVVTLVLRWFDRPRPVIRLEGRLVSDARLGSGFNGRYWPAPCTLMNIGDGDAYDVRLFGSNCDPGVETEGGHWAYSMPVIHSGSTVRIHLGLPETWSEADASVIVTWAPRPGRWFRRRSTFPIQNLPVEELLPPGALPIVQIPHRARSTRALEARSIRAQRQNASREADQ